MTNSTLTLNLNLTSPADIALLGRIVDVLQGAATAVPAEVAQIGAKLDQMGADLQRAREALAAEAAETEAQVQADKPKRGRRPKTEGPVAEAEPVNPPEPQAQPEPVTIDGEAEEADETMAQENAREEAPPAPAVDPAADFKAAMQEHINAKGVPATIAVLNKFGATKMSELKPADMPRAAAAMREALQPAPTDPWA